MQLNPITRKSASAAILLLLIVLIATAVRSLSAPFGVELADTPYRGRALSLVFAVLLLLFGGFVEGKMLVRSGLNRGYCTLPIPLYGVVACGIFVAPDTLPSAVASVCLAMSLHLFLRSLHSAGEKDSIFFASILLGTMVLFYPPAILLAGVLVLMIFALSLSIRQAMLLVIGYLLPLLTASYVMWYKGDSLWQFWANLKEAIATPQMDAIATTPYVAIAMAVVVAVILIWGAVYSLFRPHKMFLLARVRRALHIFIGVLVISLLMLLMPSCNLAILPIVAVPTAILLSLALDILPNNHSAIAYWVLLVLAVLHLFIE